MKYATPLAIIVIPMAPRKGKRRRIAAKEETIASQPLFPRDMQRQILSHLKIAELQKFRRVCRQWKEEIDARTKQEYDARVQEIRVAPGTKRPRPRKPSMLKAACEMCLKERVFESAVGMKGRREAFALLCIHGHAIAADAILDRITHKAEDISTGMIERAVAANFVDLVRKMYADRRYTLFFGQAVNTIDRCVSKQAADVSQSDALRQCYCTMATVLRDACGPKRNFARAFTMVMDECVALHAIQS